MHILILDEEPNIRRVLMCTVEPEHSAIAVNSWRAAWEYLQKQPVDVVLLDLCLSDCDGLDLISLLLSGGRCGAVIAYSTLRQEEAAVSRGAIACLFQPFTPNELRQALARVTPRPLSQSAPPRNLIVTSSSSQAFGRKEG